MSIFTIRLADKTIEISALHDYVKEYCKDYLTTGKSDFAVEITQADIDYEKEKSQHEDIKKDITVRQFHDDYLETLAVYRKIVEMMIEYDTLLLHGSVIAVDGMGYLFTAKSGTGKSTHTRLWKELFGGRAAIINDDKPLICVSEKVIMVYGTPWNGKQRLSINTSVPLKALCILERSEDNRIEEIAVKQAYNMLVQQVYKPNSGEKLIKTLQLIDRLTDRVKLYRLGCNMDISAAKIAYDAMRG